MAKSNKTCYSGIGGQAVLEGIMMRNRNQYSVAVRLTSGEINVQRWEDESFSDKHKWAKFPFIRGVVNFVESMTLGMKTLSYSAEFFDDDEPDSKFDLWLKKTFGDKAESIVMGMTTVFSLLLAVVIFMLIPYFASEWIGKFISNQSLVLIIEGALRIIIFLIYVTAISLMKDIKRLYQYHGAEHKCINCIESGKPLNIKNVMKSSRLHRRCGTSFLLFVVVISIVVFFFIRVDKIWLRSLLRLALVPVIASISYEILRFMGTHDGLLVRIFSVPGMLLQKITTREPDEQMVEVAIAAVESVFDWEKFQKKHFKQKNVNKDITTDEKYSGDL